MSNPTLGLAMIVRNEDVELERLFSSIPQGTFDQIVVVINNNSNPRTHEVVSKYANKIEVINHETHPNFFVKTKLPELWGDQEFIDPHYENLRNYSYSLCETDFIMYLDADDELMKPEELKTTFLNALTIKPTPSVIEMPYHYDHDLYGNVVTILWVARITRRGAFNWKGVVHECLLPVQDFNKCRVENVHIKHHVDIKRVNYSSGRNLRLSKYAYDKEVKDGAVDARTTLYYGKALEAVGLYKEAVQIYREFLEESEWDDERYQVMCKLANIYNNGRMYGEAQEFARRALTLRPLFGEAYFRLADTAFRNEKWDECIHYVKMGMASKCPVDLIPVDPSEYNFKPLLLLEFALFNLGRAYDSLDVIEKALAIQPKNEHLLERKKLVLAFIARMKLEESALTLNHWLCKEGDPKKVEHLLKSLPEVVKDHPVFVKMINTIGNPQGRGVIQIYCGPTFEAWSPDTAKEKGLGGSEEAVVYLSQEFTKLGWTVEVYNNCERPGVYNGVEYKNFWTHDATSYCDVFIAWRNSEYVSLAPKGSKAFIWLHDRQKPDYWTPDRVERAKKIFVLSNYHRQDLLEIPDDKFVISRNGIVPAHFAGVSQLKRDPYKCFYASSPDRGLDILLANWPEIKSKVKEATLHVFYGFSKTYDLLHKDHQKMLDFKEAILKQLRELDGVVYHGKVPHHVLHEHMMTSGLWLYPTYFTEISCITAMKAQVAGAIPICTNLAALDETVQYGYKLAFGIQDTRTQKSFVNIAVDLLKNPEKQEKIRKPMMEWALNFYDWKNVARQWDELFRNSDTDTNSQETQKA